MYRTGKTFVTCLLSVALAIAPMVLAPPQASAQTTADYDVIQDGNFTLSSGAGNDTRDFTINILSRLNSGSNAVLMFKYNPSDDAQNLDLEVQINNVVVVSLGDIAPGPLRGFWEVFLPSEANLHDGSNTLEFRKARGQGSITISDVVLLYRRTP
jgi:hypothetical protein